MITFTVTAPVVKAPPVPDTYVLKVKAMHGDGELYDERLLLFKRSNPGRQALLCTTIEIFHKLETGADAEWLSDPSDWETFIEGAGINTDHISNVNDWVFDMIPSDVTTNGNSLASYDGFTLTYIDDKGVEWDVTIDYGT